jgi:hypothetical protein
MALATSTIALVMEVATAIVVGTDVISKHAV